MRGIRWYLHGVYDVDIHYSGVAWMYKEASFANSTSRYYISVFVIIPARSSPSILEKHLHAFEIFYGTHVMLAPREHRAFGTAIACYLDLKHHPLKTSISWKTYQADSAEAAHGAIVSLTWGLIRKWQPGFSFFPLL